eukprot:7671904-Pyramimonas_sp.AAC.1
MERPDGRWHSRGCAAGRPSRRQRGCGGRNHFCHRGSARPGEGCHLRSRRLRAENVHIRGGILSGSTLKAGAHLAAA